MLLCCLDNHRVWEYCWYFHVLDQTAFYNANGIEICIRVLPHDEIGILISINNAREVVGAPSDMHHDIGSCQGAGFLEWVGIYFADLNLIIIIIEWIRASRRKNMYYCAKIYPKMVFSKENQSLSTKNFRLRRKLKSSRILEKYYFP